MSVLAAEIKFYRSSVVNDTTANGGRMSSTQITSNSANNAFPNVSDAERTAGITRYRKVYMKNCKAADDEALLNADLWISQKSLGQDYYRVKEGTNSDTQAEADDYTGWKGTGLVSQNIAPTDTSIEVTYDAATGVNDGNRLYIKEGSTTAEVTVSGAPSWAGSVATITLTGQVGATFTASNNPTCATIVDLDTIQATSSAWVETSAAGTYDETTYPLTMYNLGTVADTWTITFLSASTFSVTGTNTGSVGNGSTLADFKPVNGSSYYFLLAFAGFGGTWAVGDTITFTTTHAAKAFWLKEVVPAGSAAYSNNSTVITWRGES